MENSLGIRASVSLTTDLGKSRKEFDEKNTESCYELLKSWTPQFDPNLPISGLPSGVIASDSVQSDLLRANSVGTDCFHKFLKERVESSKIPFYIPLKKNKLKTFNSEVEKKTRQVDSKNVTVTADRDMFARMLLIREVRKELVSIRELLNYSLGPLPWALATADGGLRKTTKSQLLKCLEPYARSLDGVPPQSVQIFDEMVTLQQLPPELASFGHISDHILHQVTMEQSRIIFFVTDRYLPSSIKSIEREVRGNLGTIQVKVERRDQSRPKQFKKFLADGKNTISLVRFLLKHWSSHVKHISRLQDKMFFFTVDEECHELTSCNCKVKKETVGEHEADTKMFLCAKFASYLGYSKICFHTVDTDVFVLVMYFQMTITSARFFIVLRAIGRKKVFVISDSTLPKEMTEALPGSHALTGCDSTSAFHGKGKSKAFALALKDPAYLNAL